MTNVEAEGLLPVAFGNARKLTEDRIDKPMKITSIDHGLLLSAEIVAKMEEDWSKLYPDIPFSVGAFMTKIIYGVGE